MKDELLSSEKARAILANRKAIIAKKKLDFTFQEESSLLLFKIDNIQKYALPYQQIERVIPFQQITYIPGAKPIFLGIIYYNTEIWPVISCKRLFQLQGEERISFFILCKKGSQQIALSVHEVLDQITLKNSEELTHFANEKTINGSTYIRGVYRTDIAIIDIEAIFNIVN
ncbi:chemotaxis protein CheW [Legionella busanensis]|nr:chemotaxis protein CheW [Legionella busanensis]